MAEYIMSIFQTQLMVVFSWGLHNPMKLPDDAGLAFKVNGYKHQGWVVIRYNEGKDLFNIELLDEYRVLLRHIEEVYFDSLVEVIDHAVERTIDYQERVRKQYIL